MNKAIVEKGRRGSEPNLENSNPAAARERAAEFVGNLLRAVIADEVDTNAHHPTNGHFQFHFRDADGELASDLTRFEIHSTTNFQGPATIWQTNAAGLGFTNWLDPFRGCGGDESAAAVLSRDRAVSFA